MMSQYDDETEFYQYIEKLKEIYEKNPKKATKEARSSYERLTTSFRRELLKENDKRTFYIAMVVIIISLAGLCNLKVFFMYIMGLLFFLTGFFIAINLKAFGLVFLWTHGIAGLTIIVMSELAAMFSSSFLKDAPLKIYIWLGTIILFFILGFMSTILYNLSEVLREKKSLEFIPLVLFGIAIILVVVLSKYVSIHFGINAADYFDF